ncbi:MAG: protein kinase [Polyangiaceae bacterium]
MALSPGDIIDDKYRIVRLLGEGGMGAVYEAENNRIARRVAIKVLLGDAAERPDVVQRFEREAQAAGRIGSDHILEILDFGNLPNGDRFMVMEMLDGEELSSRIKRQVLTPEQTVPLFLQLLDGLAAAHAAGIVHRDLKPDNIFILKEKAGHKDFVKIIDFGISKFNQLNDSEHSKTKTGMLMGTPYYLSPEQARGAARSDPRSDIYSCGVILYQCVTGTVPFDAETLNELLFAIVLSPPRPIDEVAPHLDAGFRSIIQRSMARELHERFQSAQEFRDALEAWSQGRGYVAPMQPMQTAPADMSGQVAAVGMMTPQTPNLPVDTRASWSQSQDMGQVPKKSSAGLFIGLGAAAFLLLGGLGLGAVFMLRGSPEPPPVEPAAQGDAPTDPAKEEPKGDDSAEADEAKLEADEAKLKADEAKLDADEEKLKADEKAEEKPDEKAADPVASKPAAPKPAAPKPAAPKPAAPKPAAPTPAKPAKPDFGY